MNKYQAAIAYCKRGKANYQLGQYQAAIEDYDQAICLEPKLAFAYNNRGKAKYRLDQYQEAIKDFGQAICLEPKLAVAYYNRGAAKEKLECIDKARSDLQIALRLAQEAGDEKLAAAISNTIQEIDNPETQ